MNRAMTKQEGVGSRYAAVEVGDRWGAGHEWGVMAERGAAAGWELLSVGCTREQAQGMAGRLNASSLVWSAQKLGG